MEMRSVRAPAVGGGGRKSLANIVIPIAWVKERDVIARSGGGMDPKENGDSAPEPVSDRDRREDADADELPPPECYPPIVEYDD
jgi:hypothetical protein